MIKKPKLELTWIGKENRPRLEPRILLEDPEKSYHAPHRVREAEYETAENAKIAKKRRWRGWERGVHAASACERPGRKDVSRRLDGEAD